MQNSGRAVKEQKAKQEIRQGAQSTEQQIRQGRGLEWHWESVGFTSWRACQEGEPLLV